MDWNPDYHKIGMEGLAVQEAPGVAHQAVAGEFQQPVPGPGVTRHGPPQLPPQDGGRFVAHWRRPFSPGDERCASGYSGRERGW
jgi:hypothetical protein